MHILHSLIPPESTASQNYSLRPRFHNLQLPDHPNHLTDSNLTVRMLEVTLGIVYFIFILLIEGGASPLASPSVDNR